MLSPRNSRDLFRRERNLTHLAEFGQRMLPFLRQCYESELATKSLDMGSSLDELMGLFPRLELKFLRGNASEIAEYLKKGGVVLAIAGPLTEAWERLDTRDVCDISARAAHLIHPH